MSLKKISIGTVCVFSIFLLPLSLSAATAKKKTSVQKENTVASTKVTKSKKTKKTPKKEKETKSVSKEKKAKVVSKDAKAKKQTSEPTAKPNKKTPSAFVQKSSPILEIVPQASIPVGYLAQVYKGGGGFRLGFHFKFPLKKQPKVPLEIRGGFQWGMGFYPSYRGLVIASPMYPELTILFPLGVASPYLRIGGGLMVSAYLPSEEIASTYSSYDLKKASADGLFVFTFGSYFNPPKAKSISILLEMQFLTAVENRVGMFINIGFGVAYHFDGDAWT